MLAVLVPSGVSAQLSACRLPDRISVPHIERPARGEVVRTPPVAGYLLTLSWSPQHCAKARDSRGDRDGFQCSGESGAFGFVLHGLWPEAATPGYPQWCRPARIVPGPVLRRNLCMTPSAQLLQHEWAKHGTCMSPNPAAYFNAARILFGAVRFPNMRELAAHGQTAGSLRRAFADRNRGVTPAMLAISTDRQGWLNEVRFCLGPRMRPQNCRSFQRGAPDRVRVRIRYLGVR